MFCTEKELYFKQALCHVKPIKQRESCVQRTNMRSTNKETNILNRIVP